MSGKYDLTYFSPKVDKRKSAIDGRGLFAREDISAGEVLVVKGGYVLTRAQRDQVGTLLGPSEIQITEDLFIGPTTRREREGGMMHLNHCCEPNRGLQGQVVYVALRDIRMGEELTADYAMTDDEPYEMTCRCGRPTFGARSPGSIGASRKFRPNTPAISRGSSNAALTSSRNPAHHEGRRADE
jgi:uncharacterized protein